MARWLKKDSSLGFAAQSNYGTEQTSGFTWIACGNDVGVDLAREAIQMELLEGQAGASTAPLFGSKHGGKVTFKIPLTSLQVGYDGTSDTIGSKVPPWWKLMAGVLGSGTANASFDVAYLASVVDVGSTTTSIVTDTGTHTVGAAWYTGGTDGIGWIQSKTGSPETLTLSPALPNAPSSGVARYPTTTIALTTVQPVPLTIRYVGSATELAYVFVGCIPESASLTPDARQVPVLELSYVFTDHFRSDTVGGLQVPANFTRVQPAISSKGARFLLGGVIKHGVGDLKLEVTNEIAYIDSHNATQGVYEAVVTSKKVKVTCSVPIDSTDTITTGSSPMETLLESNGTTSILYNSGLAPGSQFSLWLPALRLAAQPKLTDKSGFYAESLEFEAAPVSTDGSSTAPASTVLRMALA